MSATDPFVHEHGGTRVVYGRGVVDRLDALLDQRGLERALVVCGANVGANRDAMAPVAAGLGDRLAGVFDGTTPEKRAGEAYATIEAMREADADVLVGLGGGSSLDIARQASVLAADGRSLDDLRDEFRETGAIEPPTADAALPVAVVPTTFAGADVSSGGSIEVFDAEASGTGQPVRTSGRVRPFAVVHDPDLFATTPRSALAGSAMNGFDKGLETIYARDHAAVTDATAVRGLGLLVDGLPRLDEPDGLDRAVLGAVLVQFERQTNVLHAFGHGFARRYDLQQGAAHAVVAPAVLRLILDRVDARRLVLAEGLGVDAAGRSDDEVAERVVGAVREVRDALGQPTRLRDLPDVEAEDLPDVAAFVVDDPAMARGPEGFDPSADEVEALLRELW